MNRALRYFLNAATVLALALCAPAMWWAEPDRTTSKKTLLALTEDQINEELSQSHTSWQPAARPGHYLVERPGPDYGDLFVPLPRTRISLHTALLVLLALPIARCVVFGAMMIRKYRLIFLFPAASLFLWVGLIGWRVLGTPFTYRESSVAGNFALLHGKPPSLSWYGTYQSYDLPLGEEQFPFGLAVALSLVWPISWLRWKLRRRSSTTPASGLCAVCNYDLRATPRRCPECGTVPGQSDRPVG